MTNYGFNFDPPKKPVFPTRLPEIGFSDVTDINSPGYDWGQIGTQPTGAERSMRGPGLSLGPGLMPSRVSQFIGKAGLGKAGMFGVPYLGTALAIGGALGLGKMFRRRSGPDQDQLDMDSLSQSSLGQSQAMERDIGTEGERLRRAGREAILLGRSRSLNALTNPSIRIAQEANLASNIGNARAGLVPYAGILGGAGAGARFARNFSQYDPSLAQGLVGIGRDAFDRQAQAGQMLTGFGDRDFTQGLGMKQTAYQIGQAGRAQRTAYLGDKKRLAAQKQAARQQLLGQVAGLAARGATGGLFG